MSADDKHALKQSICDVVTGILFPPDNKGGWQEWEGGDAEGHWGYWVGPEVEELCRSAQQVVEKALDEWAKGA